MEWSLLWFCLWKWNRTSSQMCVILNCKKKNNNNNKRRESERVRINHSTQRARVSRKSDIVRQRFNHIKKAIRKRARNCDTRQYRRARAREMFRNQIPSSSWIPLDKNSIGHGQNNIVNFGGLFCELNTGTANGELFSRVRNSTERRQKNTPIAVILSTFIELCTWPSNGQTHFQEKCSFRRCRLGDSEYWQWIWQCHLLLWWKNNHNYIIHLSRTAKYWMFAQMNMTTAEETSNRMHDKHATQWSWQKMASIELSVAKIFNLIIECSCFNMASMFSAVVHLWHQYVRNRWNEWRRCASRLFRCPWSRQRQVWGSPWLKSVGVFNRYSSSGPSLNHRCGSPHRHIWAGKCAKCK